MTTKASFVKTLNNNSPPSEDQLNQQINDRLSQLWTGMRNKRKQFLRNLTPSYSRRSQLTTSQINTTNQAPNSSAIDHQLTKMKDKLVSEESNRKLKETEVEKLKQTIAQLTNDKKLLAKQLNSATRGNESYQNYEPEHQSYQNHHLHHHVDNDVNVDGKTANFCHSNNNKQKSSQIFQRKKSPAKTDHSINKSMKENQYQNQTRTSQSHIKKQTLLSLDNLSRTRLIELLKSTSEYREFAYYYDSHELSYLKRLQQQHKKNCTNNYSSIEKQYWAPTEILQRIKLSNAKQHWGLNQTQIQEIISQTKIYFQTNQNEKIKDLKNHYHQKIQKLKREKQNKIPYDLVRLANAKDREMGKRRVRSIRQ